MFIATDNDQIHNFIAAREERGGVNGEKSTVKFKVLDRLRLSDAEHRSGVHEGMASRMARRNNETEIGRMLREVSNASVCI